MLYYRKIKKIYYIFVSCLIKNKLINIVNISAIFNKIFIASAKLIKKTINKCSFGIDILKKQYIENIICNININKQIGLCIYIV